MRGIDPPIRPHPQTRNISMCVLLIPKWTKQNLPPVTLPVTIGILKIPDVRNAPRNAAVAIRQHPNRHVQTIHKISHLVSPAVTIRVLQNLDRILAALNARTLSIHPAIFRRRKRIFRIRSHPESPPRVKRQIDRLVDHRLAGKKLDLKPRRQRERGRLLLRRPPLARSDQGSIRLGRR